MLSAGDEPLYTADRQHPLPGVATEEAPISVTFRLDRFDSEFSARTTLQDWQRIVGLRDHPQFLRGAGLYNREIPEFFAESLLINKVATQFSRFQMLVFALHLHDTADATVPTSGLTLSRLQGLCRTHKLASAGAVATFLSILLVAGYATAQRHREDGRTVHLVLTEDFVATVERWTRIVVRAVDTIEPEGRLAEAHVALPRFGWDLRKGCAEALLSGWKPVEPFPEVAHFMASHGGWMLMATCMAETMRAGGGETIVPVSIDLAVLAKRLGGSRTQLRRLLEGAHAKGLLDAAPGNGRHVRLSERMVASWLTSQASELAIYRQAGIAAQRAIGRTYTSPQKF